MFRQNLDNIRKEKSINRYKDWDFSKPQVLQIEVPIASGNFPVFHTQTTAFLTQDYWENLPPEEQAKWRSAPWKREDRTQTIFFRTYSTSLGNNHRSCPNSWEGDYFIANTLLGRADAELPPQKRIPRHGEWYIRSKPAPITRYFLSGKTGKVRPYYFSGKRNEYVWTVAPDDDGELRDSIGSLGPANIAPILLYDDRIDNGHRMPIEVTINDAMNAGEEISNAVSRMRPYWLTTNNCHFGTISANALNPFFVPGKFSSGGLKGYSMSSNSNPYWRNIWSRIPGTRLNVPFVVDQQDIEELKKIADFTRTRLKKFEELMAWAARKLRRAKQI